MNWPIRQRVYIVLALAGIMLLWVVFVKLTLGAGLASYPTEAEWQDANAQRYGAEVEVRLWDGTRCDFVSPTHAIEIDWAYRGWSSIAQATWYAGQLGKKPGIILLVRTGRRERDRRMVYRLLYVAAKYDIDVWVEEVGPKAEEGVAR